MSEEKIKQAAKVIKQAKRIAILTGAGVSKESGVPTFRDAMDGLWAKYDPQQLATARAFRQNPKLVWDWYQFRVGLVSKAKPNAGHFALAQLEHQFPETWTITQNVDALHEESGSKSVIHLHGNLSQYKCFGNCQGEPTIIDIDSFEWDRENGPPACPHCGDWVRPNIVWFGEMLPLDQLDKAKVVTIECDVMIVVGTSGLVTPAADLPRYAKETGATIIEANPDYSMITRIADIKLDGPSGEMLPKVVEALDNA